MLTAEISQDELRQKVLDVARKHKASWIELGQYLYTIQKNKMYKYWGYLAFDAYCSKELGIRQNTAIKMLRSYQYLEREEPETIRVQESGEETAARRIPSFEAVNLLRLARKNKFLTDKDVTKIREDVMAGTKEPKEVRAQVRRLISERDERDPREVRKIRRNQAIRRLISTLSNTGKELENEHLLPSYILKQISDLTHKLEDQIE
jgi:hypothetical protein